MVSGCLATRIGKGRRRRELEGRLLFFAAILALTSEKSIDGGRDGSSHGK
jgi:hypothetical protein